MAAKIASLGTIVCIEDNEDTLACFPFLFPDCTVRGATTGAAGLVLAKTGDVHLYIVDYRLPDMTGTDVCRAIRGAGSKTPIVVCSGNDVEREARAAGADAFMLKGRDPAELQSLAYRLMRALAPAKAVALRTLPGIAPQART